MTARTRKQGATSKAADDAETTEQDAPVQGPAGSVEVTAEETLGPEQQAMPATTGIVQTAATEEPERPDPADVPSPETDTGYQYLNVSGGPLTYTEDGHQVDEGAWTPTVRLDRVGRGARDRGHLKSRSALGMT